MNLLKRLASYLKNALGTTSEPDIPLGDYPPLHAVEGELHPGEQKKEGNQ